MPDQDGQKDAATTELTEWAAQLTRETFRESEQQVEQIERRTIAAQIPNR